MQSGGLRADFKEKLSGREGVRLDWTGRSKRWGGATSCRVGPRHPIDDGWRAHLSVTTHGAR